VQSSLEKKDLHDLKISKYSRSGVVPGAITLSKPFPIPLPFL